MKTLTPSSKNHVLKILCSLLLLLVMTPGVLAQEAVSDERSDILDKEGKDKINADPDKAATYRLNVVGSDALIYGLTVGRGGGDIFTNAAFGGSALLSNSFGDRNSAFGSDALRGNTTGSFNTAVGRWALRYNSVGNNNVGVGFVALRDNQGHHNTAVGYEAMILNTTGYSNVAMGAHALFRNTVRSNLVAVGDSALYSNGLNATQSYQATANTALGSKALYANTIGFHNTATGSQALRSNTTGYENTALGSKALYANTTGYQNTATGFQALYENTTGYSNTATGRRALYSNTTGNWNTATGFQALNSNTTGFQNTATGFQALNSNTGSWNTATGCQALYSHITGYGNTATGSQALMKHTTGVWNTAYGANALHDLTAGSQNVAIGDNAGLSIASITQGTFIGSEAKPSITGLTNVTGIGYLAMPTASNQVRIGNTSVTSIGGQVGWTNFSDGGYKNNVEEDVAGLDFILKLRPVSYNLDAHRLASDLGEDQTRDEDGSKATAVPDEITQKSRDEKAAIRYTGFIAQEVEATVNELGVTFSGVDAPVNKSGFYGLRYAEFVVPLVRAVQEQQAHIEALSPEGIDDLKSELAALRAENQLMHGQINEIISLLENLGVDLRQSTGYGINEGQQQYPSGNARLEQNTPNPFNANTLIRYFVPEETHRAQIIITDMAGLQVMAFPLEHQGAGQVLIHGGTLSPGSYVYTLVINGRIADSKRMLLL